MAMIKLTWSASDQDVHFLCKEGDHLLPAELWATNEICLPSGLSARLGPLLAGLEAESEVSEKDGGVNVGHKFIADLSNADLAGLGLPPIMPFTLEIESWGIFTDPNFTIRWRFFHPGGRPVMGADRQGAILTVGQQQFTVGEPYFSIIESIESFNHANPGDLDARMSSLAEVKAALPNDIQLGPHLDSATIARADSFTILPFLDESGSVDFNVAPVYSMPASRSMALTEEKNRAYALPEARQSDWFKRFRATSNVRRQFAVGGGWYLVVTEPVQNALEEVRQIMASSPEKRRAFIANPRVFLKEKLGDRIAEETLENLFWESAEYSERVREIGIWTHRILPYLKPASQPWLPPEAAGLIIDDVEVPINPVDIPSLIARVEEAISKGESHVAYNSGTLPATQNCLEALRRIQVGIDESATTAPNAPSQPEDEKSVTALLIKNNLDQLDYQRSARPILGEIGGLPSGIRSQLLPHQKHGVRWLQQLWAAGKPGGLLADDMGLGKTLQALSFLKWVREQLLSQNRMMRPILVVGPTGLLRNWVAEHENHFDMPGLGMALEAQGQGLRSLRGELSGRGMELVGGMPVLDIRRLEEAEWVLTTYETLRDYQHSFGRIRWAVMVLDEAQKIKNPEILMTDAAKAMNADFTIALTGTPVENRLSDLWCIVDTVQPGALGSLKSFVSRYEKDTADHGNSLKDLKDLLTATPDSAIMLRRMKADHLKGLPQMQVKIGRVSMPPKQADTYSHAVREARSGAAGKGHILEVLQKLRAISLHPAHRGQESDKEFINQSARFSHAFEILDQVRMHQEKALVFLDDRLMQGVLADLVQRRYQLKTPPLIISGAVAGQKRKERADDFQSRTGFDVMILSPRAGGIGLTLTAANHVIHLSRWWNPAVEDQSTDRVYRIGQLRPVNVYIPIAVHPEYTEFSFDNRLHELLERKRSLSRDVLAPTTFSQKDFESLYAETTRI